MNTALRVTYR